MLTSCQSPRLLYGTYAPSTEVLTSYKSVNSMNKTIAQLLLVFIIKQLTLLFESFAFFKKELATDQEMNGFFSWSSIILTLTFFFTISAIFLNVGKDTDFPLSYFQMVDE